jgi:hypothetical protein
VVLKDATALAARLRLPRLQSDRRIIILFEVFFIDHPADHSAQCRQQIACGVRVFISALMTLRVSTANGLSPFSGKSDSINPVR